MKIPNEIWSSHELSYQFLPDPLLFSVAWNNWSNFEVPLREMLSHRRYLAFFSQARAKREMSTKEYAFQALIMRDPRFSLNSRFPPLAWKTHNKSKPVLLAKAGGFVSQIPCQSFVATYLHSCQRKTLWQFCLIQNTTWFINSKLKSGPSAGYQTNVSFTC